LNALRKSKNSLTQRVAETFFSTLATSSISDGSCFKMFNKLPSGNVKFSGTRTMLDALQTMLECAFCSFQSSRQNLISIKSTSDSIKPTAAAAAI
jgi:hypothetical protein